MVRSILPNEIRETVKLRGVMRFLADAGISRNTVEFLRLRGHDAVHVRDLLLQRAADRDLVDKARADRGGRLLSTGVSVRSILG